MRGRMKRSFEIERERMKISHIIISKKFAVSIGF